MKRNTIQHTLKILIFSLMVVSACTSDQNEDTTIVSSPAGTQNPLATTPDRGCGNGVCEGPENHSLCPQDCPAESTSNPDPATSDFGQDGLVEAVYLEIDQNFHYRGLQSECWYAGPETGSLLTNDDGFAVLPSKQDGSQHTPLLFTIVVHIEPSESYNTLQTYLRDRNRLTRLAEIIASHGGSMTIQTQRPFITTSQIENDGIHKTWEDMGHEIAVHFHENEYVPSTAPLEEWVFALRDLRDEIQGLVSNPITTWSGGNLYENIFSAAYEANLWINTNFKDPTTQSIDSGFLTISPWRPAGQFSSNDALIHDSNANIIYLPSGVYPAHCDKPEAVPRPYTTQAFDYLTTALIHSLRSVRPGFVNVFYTTMHPGDFLGTENDELELTRWEEWLSIVIDPLVADGRLQWSTTTGMGQAFIDWEMQQ